MTRTVVISRAMCPDTRLRPRDHYFTTCNFPAVILRNRWTLDLRRHVSIPLTRFSASNRVTGCRHAHRRAPTTFPRSDMLKGVRSFVFSARRKEGDDPEGPLTRHISINCEVLEGLLDAARAIGLCPTRQERPPSFPGRWPKERPSTTNLKIGRFVPDPSLQLTFRHKPIFATAHLQAQTDFRYSSPSGTDRFFSKKIAAAL
jgi:hypothetical protein